ncbi:S1C family serine protease [Leptolyngbyaceae cyanobacterium UHCC 1019]
MLIGTSTIGTTLGLFALNEFVLTQSAWITSSRVVAQEVAEQVAAKAIPAVVRIDTSTGTGSGVIISADGKVITNAHVVRDSSTVTITLQDGTKAQAKVVSVGEVGGNRDLALLKIEGKSNFPTLPPGGTASLRVGQQVFAIGFPFGGSKFFSQGVVSQVNSQKRLIYTDAAINKGNSGGPLLNRQGEVIGINTAGPSENVNYAISIDSVQAFLRQPATGPKQTACVGKQSLQQIKMDGSVIAARLGQGSNTLNLDKSVCSIYNFSGQAGQFFRIDLVSLDFNPWMTLLRPDGSRLGNDFGGNVPYARLQGTLPENGTYQLITSTFDSGEAGAYSLQMQKFIILQSGRLSDESPRLPSDNSPHAEFSFRGEAGKPINITVESSEFKTFLFLKGPDGKTITKDKRRISGKLPSSGLYSVIVNAEEASGRGRFTLMVR